LFAAAAEPIIAPTAMPPITPAATAPLSRACASVDANIATERLAATAQARRVFVIATPVTEHVSPNKFSASDLRERLHGTTECRLNILAPASLSAGGMEMSQKIRAVLS
jgi:hypothetical protein